MGNSEFEKSKTFTLADVQGYLPNSIIVKEIIKKITGNVSIIAFDSREALSGPTSPFDTFIQIIDGEAEVLINEVSHLLETGQAIIIPAHSRNKIIARTRFKMLSTVIKSGYEDII